MTLYDRLASTPEGAKALAVARLENECRGALWEAFKEMGYGPDTPNAVAARTFVEAKAVHRICSNDGRKFTVQQLAELMHDMGKEIMITVVPAGEPRRIAEQEMAEVTDRQNADKGLKENR